MTQKTPVAKKDYNKLKKTAYELYMMGKPGKEIATALNISAQTVSTWAKKYAWKSQRTAKIINPKTRTENIRTIMELLSERRLKLFHEVNALENAPDKPTETHQMLLDLRNEAASIDDSISKWNKTLMNLDKENRISLGVYLDVMDDLFNALRIYDMVVYRSTLDFQEQYIQTITNRLGT